MRNHRRAVVSASAVQLDEVARLVREGRYKNLSEFVRRAMGEALLREKEARLAEALERHIDAGHADEDEELVDWQAWPGARPARRVRSARRAKR